MRNFRLFGILVVLFIALPTPTFADDRKDYGDYAKIAINDDVKWIDATSINPGDYIGQIFLVKKDNSTIPFFAPIAIPFAPHDEPTVKKSILIKAASDGSVSFGNFIKISGAKEHVFQFQIVDSKKWIADMKSKDYIKAVSAFRNDPATSMIFESDDYAGIVMVVGVVGEKIWYKSFQKDSLGVGGSYFVKVEGNSYNSSEDYEEITRYGLLLRPLSGFGFKLPKAIVSTAQVTEISDKLKLSDKTNAGISKGVQLFVIGKSKLDGPDQIQ